MLVQERKSPAMLVLTRVGGILFFLLMVVLANIAVAYVRIPEIAAFVYFINANLALLILMSIVFFAGEIFGILVFPLNLPGPVFGAVGGVLFAYFFFTLMYSPMIYAYVKLGLFNPAGTFAYIVYAGVFVLALAAGYASIFWRLFRGERKERREERRKES